MAVVAASSGRVDSVGMTRQAHAPVEAIGEVFSEFTAPGSAGCAVAVIRGGEIDYAAGYGLANLEFGIPFTQWTVVNLGSMSKQFTAFLVALLESEGAMSFDDDIRTYLPELHDFGPTITVRHLIHHTSGLRGTYPELFALAGWRMTDLMTTEQVLALMANQRELNYRPGTEFLYINSGYTLLALIVERIVGESFGGFARRRLFKPLGMQNTLVLDDPGLIVLNAAGGYYRSDDGTWVRVPLTDSVVGPTNVWSNVEDLALWDRNFVSGEVGGPDVVARVIEPGRLDDGTPLGYAFGLEASPDAQHRGWRIIEHGGQHGGHCSWMVRFPDAGISVAVLFNSFMWSTREYALRVADLYLEDRSPAMPVEQEPGVGASVEVTDPGRWTGVYFDPARAALRTVAFENGTLTYEHMPMTAIGPERFVIDAEPSVEVELSGEGGSRKVVTHTRSGDYRYDVVESPGANLAAYAGTFESPELGVRWVIEVGAERLVVHRPRFPDTIMTPVFRDGFEDDWGPVMEFPFSFVAVFERDAAGVVDGLRVSGDRVRNLRFVRVG